MNHISRRKILKSGLALAIPTIVPATVFGANAPSNRITLGCIGTGNQGFNDMKGFLQNEDAQILAVCDVNRASYGYKTEEQYYGREPARQLVNDFYAEKTGNGSYQDCAAYSDFREIMARDDIDAVVIVVPDQWHAAMTVMAARRGKDIYCEKPLSLTIADGRAMVEAVRRYGVILQTGSHERSRRESQFAIELVRNGRIGDLRRIIAIVGPNNKTAPSSNWQPTPVPEGFDYDIWLGPARWVPYHKDRCLYNFRFGLDYSGGQVTNYGAHSLDLAQWANGTEHTGPLEVEDLGGIFPKDGLFDTATRVHFRVRYANGVELICKTGPENVQVRFEGTDGWVQTGYRGFSTSPRNLQSTKIGSTEYRVRPSNDHYRNFLDCIKNRTDPVAPVEIGHRSATICHLGNIAMLLQRKLHWDPNKECFTGDDEANRMLSRAYREPWHR